MSDEAAFLTAIQADPADDAPRLVYADWLDEHGRSDQAEAIRSEHARRAAQTRWETVRDRMDPDWMAARVFPANAIVVRSYPAHVKIGLIKLIRELTGRGLAEAKAMSESLPIRLKGPWSSSDLDRIRTEFAQLGIEASSEYVLPE